MHRGGQGLCQVRRELLIDRNADEPEQLVHQRARVLQEFGGIDSAAALGRDGGEVVEDVSVGGLPLKGCHFGQGLAQLAAPAWRQQQRPRPIHGAKAGVGHEAA